MARKSDYFLRLAVIASLAISLDHLGVLMPAVHGQQIVSAGYFMARRLCQRLNQGTESSNAWQQSYAETLVVYNEAVKVNERHFVPILIQYANALCPAEIAKSTLGFLKQSTVKSSGRKATTPSTTVIRQTASSLSTNATNVPQRSDSIKDPGIGDCSLTLDEIYSISKKGAKASRNFRNCSLQIQ